ncbi:hypothetical protein LAWI1_G007528 [Lachnellula willkommii]|uniref:2EXR domain-containing protein n=1 Tax=Lachnellula willkommii TaxID=215461 RepID=A0A559M3N3_9HELO|nr:hypothetical protein LAWI1_G007528 [Lachnellula willkommii]
MNKRNKMGKMSKMKSSVAKVPHHPSFPKFPKLPVELRAMIWKFTLEARIVEIDFQETRGFYTQVETPVALRVCKDSRDAAISSYPACFGNLMFTPRTVFNFSLDTLYIGLRVQSDILHLVGSLNATEISKLQSLAIDRDINLDLEMGGHCEINYESCVKRAASLMPNLRVFLQVFDLVDWLEEDCIDEGTGPMKLYLEWPTKVENMHTCPMMSGGRCACGRYHGIDSEDSDCSEYYDDGYDVDYEPVCGKHDLPDEYEMEPLPSRSGGRSTPKVSAIWGWRPTK